MCQYFFSKSESSKQTNKQTKNSFFLLSAFNLLSNTTAKCKKNYLRVQKMKLDWASFWSHNRATKNYRTLVRLTAFILAAEKVGERICLCLLHASPLACTIPTGVLCSEPTKLGSCCTKEELHSYQFLYISRHCMMPVESFKELSRGKQSSSEVSDYTCSHLSDCKLQNWQEDFCLCMSCT